MLGSLSAPNRAEKLGAVLAFAALSALHLWAARYRLDPLDEGYFLYTSSRVLAGELPYRDFATPYTPAFFFLNALLFQIFGLDVVTLRLSLLVPRLGIAVLLFLLGRRLMPPRFAFLPIAVLLAVDQFPGSWESHPAWWASFFMLLSVWAVCRYREGGRTRWWTAAALAASSAFAFKQNVGLFALAALCTVALSEMAALPASAPGWLAAAVGRLGARSLALGRLLGPLVLLLLALGTAWVTRGHLDPRLALLLVLPFGALSAERWPTERPGEPAAGVALAAAAWRLMIVGGVFVLVSVPWLVLLALRLQPAPLPLPAFFGGIDTAGYYYPLQPLSPALAPMLAGLGLAGFGLGALARPWPGWLRAAVAAAAAIVAAAYFGAALDASGVVEERLLRTVVVGAALALAGLVLYLPIPAFWAGLVLAARDRDGAAGFSLRWLLLAGSLLLLNQYPRLDETHLVHSATLLFLVGAFALWRLYAWLTRGLAPGAAGALGRALTYLAVVALPFAAVWPSLEVRRSDLVIREAGALLSLRTPSYEPLELPGASVLEHDFFAWKYRALAFYFSEHTPPGERIFVFPAAPLLYYLVDRPNATRFNHLLPGLLTAEEESEVIDRLQAWPVRYVIWDAFGEAFWLQSGEYKRLIDFVWEAYEPAESIGGYEILRLRDSFASPGPGLRRADAP